MNHFVSPLKEIQVELSTNCNALCVGCVRTDRNYVDNKPWIPKNQQLEPEILLNALKSDFAKPLKKLEFCGNIDEPLAYSKFYELLCQVYEIRPDIKVSIHTNGSIRSPEYIRKVGDLLGKFSAESNFRFSLDGVGDTNAIYRYRTNWNKVFENLKAACESDAKVIWQFLTFPWNSHQVEEARKMATEVGCDEIWIRPDRSTASLKSVDELSELRSNTRPASACRPEGDLSVLENMPPVQESPIHCTFSEHGRIFLSWEAKIWPCCFISNIKYESKAKGDHLQKTVLDKYGEHFNDLNHHSFDEIMAHPYFVNELVDSWQSENNLDSLNWRCRNRCRSSRRRVSDNKIDDKKIDKFDL